MADFVEHLELDTVHIVVLVDVGMVELAEDLEEFLNYR